MNEREMREILTKELQEKPCSVRGCDRMRRTKGLCQSHYQQYRRTGKVPTKLLRPRSTSDTRVTCAYDDRPVCSYWGPKRLPLCTMHYQRAFRNGDPTKARPRRPLTRTPGW